VRAESVEWYVLARVLPLVEETGYDRQGRWSLGHLTVRPDLDSVRPWCWSSFVALLHSTTR